MTAPSPRPAPLTLGSERTDDTITSSSDFSIIEAVQQLIRERKAIEDYARTAYAGLSELRERIRAERIATDAQASTCVDRESLQSEIEQLKRQLAEVQPQLDQLRNERNEATTRTTALEQNVLVLQTAHDAGQAQIKLLKADHEQAHRQLARIRVECELAEGEEAQSRRQLEEERNRDKEITILLQRVIDQAREQAQPQIDIEKLKAECGRLTQALHSSQQREQSLRERLTQSGDLVQEKEQMLRERRELAEKLQIVDLIEAELRQQQAAQRSKTTQAISVSAIESALMSFCCKNCNKDVQVSCRRAGLMSKCPHCNRIVPVPKR